MENTDYNLARDYIMEMTTAMQSKFGQEFDQAALICASTLMLTMAIKYTVSEGPPRHLTPEEILKCSKIWDACSQAAMQLFAE